MLKVIALLILFLITTLTLYNILLYRYWLSISRFYKSIKIKSLEATRPHLLDKPICEFYINSSHNSYISFFQHLSIVKTETLKKILNSGVRCIELDIAHINNKPVVAHGTADYITTTYLSLDKFLDIILEHGFNTSDPLFLFCEIFNEDNEILMNNIKTAFLNKLKSRISKLTNSNDYIATQPIKHFLNKIILLGSNSNILSEIMNSNSNFMNIDDTNTKIRNINQLGRVYKRGGLTSFLSLNIDYKQFFEKKYNIVCMNYQMKDKLLYEYIKFFGEYSLLHFSEKEI